MGDTNVGAWWNTIDQNKTQNVLGHEKGKGSPCLKCDRCSTGLQLHYWRKKCTTCFCQQHEHAVPPDDAILRRELLFKKQSPKKFALSPMIDINFNNPTPAFTLIQELQKEESMEFVWVPPCTSKQLVIEYMQKLPTEKIPLKGGPGAQYREMQLNMQIPIYDLAQKGFVERYSSAESLARGDFVTGVRSSAVGQGYVKRIVQGTNQITSMRQQLAAVQKSKNSPRGQELSQQVKQGSPPPPENADAAILLSNYSVDVLPEVADFIPPLPEVADFIPPPPEYANVAPLQLTTVEYLCSLFSNLAILGSPPKHDRTPYKQWMSDEEETPGRKLHKTEPAKGSPDWRMKIIFDEGLDAANTSANASIETDVLKFETQHNCDNCTLKIGFGTVAVVIDRGNTQVLWHPQCFVCYACKELLVDLVYFHDNTHIYCLRDYAKAKGINRCASCDELIFNQCYTVAEGKAYHEEHFCCETCDSSLGGHSYILEKDLPYCIDCFTINFCPTCQTCQKKVGPNEKHVKHSNLVWHCNEQCFKCGFCEKCLIDLPFLEKDGRVFCSKVCKKCYKKCYQKV